MPNSILNDSEEDFKAEKLLRFWNFYVFLLKLAKVTYMTIFVCVLEDS